MASIAPLGKYWAPDDNGGPLALGKLYTYEAGTSTPKATYTTQAGDVENTNPVELDASGFANVWLGDGGYKFILKDANDVEIFSTDNINAESSSAFGGDVNIISTNTSITTAFANSVNICTGSPTLSLLAASTAGEGFYFSVKNEGVGNVTIDPDGSETIDGASTRTLLPGQSALVITDGSTWYTLFYYGVASLAPSAINNTESTLASATTTNLGSAASNVILITGTTTITSFGSSALTTNPIYFVRFSGVLTLTHNGTSLIIPGSANITTANGDTLTAEYLGSGNWKVLSYQRVSGLPVVVGPQGFELKTTGDFTTPATTISTTLFKFTVVGGGGGGGGTNNAAAAGGGGGGGAVSYYYVTGLTASQTCTISYGAAGTAGANTGGTGGNGGNTVLTVGATVVTAFGGSGGVGSTSNTSIAGGAGGVIPTNGSINLPGQPGSPGLGVISNQIFAGDGGDTPLGNGGKGPVAAGAGVAGTGNGSGGSGAVGATALGGAGTAGAVLVEWY